MRVLEGLMGLLAGVAGPRTGRAEMDAALKRLVVPELRSMGFKGSMPHLRRPRGDHWDLLTFQFNKYGGSFLVETARCAKHGIHDWRGHVPPEKVTTFNAARRYRVGAVSPGNDHWFKFERSDPDKVAQKLLAELRKPRLWEIVDSLPAAGVEAFAAK